MKAGRSIQITAALVIATAIGVQAQVRLKPDTGSGTTMTYNFVDVATQPQVVTGNTAKAPVGSFTQIGEGSFTVIVSGQYGWTNSLATAATNDFATYLATLPTVAVAQGSDDWGVDSSSAWPGDPNNNRLNSNEVIIYTFNTTNLTKGTVQLNAIQRTINGTSEINDFVLYDSVSNKVVATIWNKPGGPTDNTVSFTNLVENGYQLIIGCHDNYDAARIDSIHLDLFVPASSETAPVILGSPVAKNSQVELDWPDDPSPAILDSYQIARSLNETNGFVVIASNLTESAYVDSGLSNNVTYYYQGYSVKTGGVVNTEGNTVSATPVVTVPTGLFADVGDQKVDLTWDGAATNDLKYGSFTVYRGYQNDAVTNAIATGITDLTYTDTNVVNELLYYYALTLVDTNGEESALSEIKGAVPTKALIIDVPEGSKNNRQGDLRVDLPEGTNAWPVVTTADRSVLGQSRAGVYSFEPNAPNELARMVLGFPLVPADLGNQTTSDIESVKLRWWATYNSLRESGPHSRVEVYHSQTRPADISISTADWSNQAYDGWTLIGTVEGLTNGAPDGWYEIDVTDEVLADLNLDDHANAGSAFQFRVNDELLYTTNMYPFETVYTTNDTVITTNKVYDGQSGSKLNDNYGKGDGGTGSPLGKEFIPQLRIKFSDNRSGYLQWTDDYLPTIIGPGNEDYDMDGFDNTHEYGVDGDPTDAQDQGTPSTFTMVGGDFKYIHPKRSADSNLVYIVETTSNLQYVPWTNMGYTVEGTLDTGGTLDFVTNDVSSVEDQKFIRLRIEYNQ